MKHDRLYDFIQILRYVLDFIAKRTINCASKNLDKIVDSRKSR